MTEQRDDNPYTRELNGSINGTPHVIKFDAQTHVREQAEREGRVLTEEDIENETLKLLQDIDRTKEALSRNHSKPPLKGILGRLIRR